MSSIPTHRRKLGEAIRARRRKAGLSQEKLAEKADLSTVFISEVECGKKAVTIDSLMRIASGLKVRPRDLVRDL